MMQTEQVYQYLRGKIFDGSFKPGQRIVEADVARALGVSRTPVREAFRELAAHDLIVEVPHQGARVKDLSAKEIEDAYEIRVVMEGYAARRAALRGNRQDCQQLLKLAAEMGSLLQAGSSDGNARTTRLVEINNEFHHLIYVMADNDKLTIILDRVIHLPIVYRAFRQYSPAELHKSYVKHQELAAAISDGDPFRAEAIMQAHIYHGLGQVMAFLER